MESALNGGDAEGTSTIQNTGGARQRGGAGASEIEKGQWCKKHTVGKNGLEVLRKLSYHLISTGSPNGGGRGATGISLPHGEAYYGEFPYRSAKKNSGPGTERKRSFAQLKEDIPRSLAWEDTASLPEGTNP